MKMLKKKKSLRSSAVSLKGHHNLSWTRGCSEAKSVNFKSQAQTLLKEVWTFSTEAVRKFLPVPLRCILDPNLVSFSITFHWWFYQFTLGWRDKRLCIEIIHHVKFSHNFPNSKYQQKTNFIIFLLFLKFTWADELCDMILNIFKMYFAVQKQKYIAAVSAANDLVHKQLRKAGFGHITIFKSLHTFAGGRDSNLLEQARKLQATLEGCNPKLWLTHSLAHRGKV